MASGTVKWFNAQKGFGFILPDEGGAKDVFFHIPAPERAGIPPLNDGQRVGYDLQSDRGKMSAGNIKLL